MRRRSQPGRSANPLASLALAALATWAVFPSGLHGGGNLEAVNQAQTALLNRFWDPQAYPVVWHQNLGSPPFSNANTPAATVHPALQDGFDVWELLPTSSIDWDFGGDSAETDVGLDGINLVTFVDSEVLAADLGFTAEAPSAALTVAVTVTDDSDGIPGNGMGILDLGGGISYPFPIGTYPAGSIVDADLRFNTFGANADQFSTNGAVVTVDLEDVAVHEEGHMHGLSHSPLHDATMYPFTDLIPINDLGAGPKELEQDDIAASSRYHPEPAFTTDFGRIRGSVTLDGETGDGVHVVAVDAATLEPVVSRFSISRFIDPIDVIEGGEAYSFPDPSPFVIDGLPAGEYRVYIEYFDTSEFLTTRLQNRYNLTILNSTVADGDPVNPVGGLGILPQLPEFYDTAESGDGGDRSTPGSSADNPDAAAVVSVQAGVETNIGDIAINLKTSGGGPPSQKGDPTARQIISRDSALRNGSDFAGILLDGGGDDFWVARFPASELPTPPYNVAEALWGRWGLSTLPYGTFLAFSQAGNADLPDLSDPVAHAGRVLTGGPEGRVAVGDLADVRDQWNFTVNTQRNLFFVIPQPESPSGITFLVEGFFALILNDATESGHSLVTENGGADFEALVDRDLFYDLVVETVPPVWMTGLAPSSVSQCSQGVSMTLTGAGFRGPAAVDLGTGFTVSSVTVDSGSQISLTADVLGPPLGDRTVTLENHEAVFPNHARLLTVLGASPHASDCDQDGEGNGTDCAPFDATTEGVPVEDGGLQVTANSDAVISWTDQGGTAGTSTVYDLVSGNLGDLQADRDFSRAACLVDDTPMTSHTDSRGILTPGDGFYYLQRGQNPCGDGTYGSGNATPNPRPDLDLSGPCT